MKDTNEAKAPKNKKWRTILIILFIFFFGRPYYKPGYSGKIIDYETGEPIQGAVIEVEHWSGHYGLIEQNSDEVFSRKYISDKDGNFHIPPFFYLICLFSWEEGTHIDIDKNYYTSLKGGRDVCNCLSSGCTGFSYKDFYSKKLIEVSSHLIKLSRVGEPPSREESLKWLMQ